MKPGQSQWVVIFWMLFLFHASATVCYVNVSNLSPVSPYTNWLAAATNIQDAIDVANPGDQILVTNGIYQYGGYSNSGSNRVYVINNLTVQSVNGPVVTIIQGYQVPGTTNGANAVRCVYLNDGTTLSGFTLTNGATQNSGSGGGVYCQSTNCLVTNCVIVGNVSDHGGAGAYSGTLINCALIGNSTPNSTGGGANNSVLTSCLLVRNFAAIGGGAIYSTLINCTVVSNSAGAFVAGASRSAVINSIVYYNSSDSVTGTWASEFTNCCTAPLPFDGVNNITNPPAFVDLVGGNLRLQIGSSCINTGDNSFITNGTDLDGNPRIDGGTVDLGAYENQYTGTVHYVSLNSTNPVSPYTNWITAATNIQDAVAMAQPGEIVVAANGVYKSGGTIVYGQTTNRVALTNAITLLAIYGPQSTVIVGGYLGKQTRCVYVGSNVVLNGFTLANGVARNSGDLIKEQSGGGAWCETSGIVSNCVFGGNNFPYANGSSPSDGCIAQWEGGGVYGGTVCNSTLTGNSAGFGGGAAAANLFNCVVSFNSLSGQSSYGGGIYQGTASNCIFTGNSAYTGGGGGYQSTLYNCVLSSNSVHSGSSGGGTYQGTNYNCTFANNSGANGGGAWGGVLYNCTLSSNTASSYGGGAYQSTLYNCTISSNTASGSGGGVEQSTLFNCYLNKNKTTISLGRGGGADASTLYNCILLSNTATNNGSGGGASQSTLYNCMISSNTANIGGGVGGVGPLRTLYNCTLLGNAASNRGGGCDNFYRLYNCIAFYNSAPSGSNYSGTFLNYCCTMPLATNGVGNITNEPVFVNLAGGNFHLQSNSPCINAGNNVYIPITNDFDGNPRIVGGTVDLGAYEYQTPSSVLSYAWAQQYGLPTDGTSDYADSDGDGFNNWQEWRTGTDPTDPSSLLKMASATPTNNPPGMVVTWQSVSGITYFLQNSTNLMAQPAFSTIQSNIIGQVNTTSYTDTNAAGSGPFFYRVGVQ